MDCEGPYRVTKSWELGPVKVVEEEDVQELRRCGWRSAKCLLRCKRIGERKKQILNRNSAEGSRKMDENRMTDGKKRRKNERRGTGRYLWTGYFWMPSE